MKFTLKHTIIAILIIATGCLAVGKIVSVFTVSQITSSLVADPASGTSVSSQSPCKQPDPLNPNWGEKERREWHQEYLRRTRGYPSDVKLAEAIGQFNIDAKCHDVVGKHQPPLTIQEVLAAARDTHPANINLSSSGLKLFDRISHEQVMPKGSLIWYDWGYNQSGGYNLTYWKIYIYVELDRYPLDEKGEHNSVRPNKQLVRLQYISSVPNHGPEPSRK